MELLHNIDIIISATGFTLSLTGLMQTVISRYMEKETWQFFISFFTVISIYSLCILIKSFTYGNTGYGWAVVSRVTLFGQAFFSSVLTVLVTAFLLHQSGDKTWRKNRLFLISVILWLIYIAVLIYAQFSTLVYSVNDDNVYSRGRFFPLLMVPPVLIMVVNLILLWQKRGSLSARQRTAFIVYIIVPLICMLLQSRLFGVHIICIGTVFSAMIMLTYFISDQMEKYRLQEAENAQYKIEILLAQIQPHFLFNSLTVIKYLCRQDPEKAEEAVSNFTSYLRHNMDSISADKPISFSEELDHVKAYLSLQKYRFGDELDVKYDLDVTDFRIPTLALLPLVENAVTYGVRRNRTRSGVVTIRTRDYPKHIEISVIDDGPGFVPDILPNDRERSHVGIKNVKERLARIAGGELRIDSSIGKGTTVTIILPKEEKR